MGYEQPQVFISSTSELTPEREALRAAILKLEPPCHPFDYLTHPPRRASPKEECERQIRHSEIFLLLLGASYGSPFPGEPMSIVEWEYEIAKKQEEAELQTFLKQFPADAAVDPRQAAFIKRVRDFEEGHWSAQGTFTTPEELCELAVKAIRGWRNDGWKRGKERAGEQTRWQDRYLVVAASALAFATLSSVVALVFRGAPISSLLIVAAVGLLCTLSLGVFRKI